MSCAETYYPVISLVVDDQVIGRATCLPVIRVDSLQSPVAIVETGRSDCGEAV